MSIWRKAGRRWRARPGSGAKCPLGDVVVPLYFSRCSYLSAGFRQGVPSLGGILFAMIMG
jgi:hypothetical protein